MKLYQFRWPLIIIATGFTVRIIGAMMKILHWRANDTVLIAGTAIMAIGLIGVIIKLVLLKNK